jgi:hypothetical protein
MSFMPETNACLIIAKIFSVMASLAPEGDLKISKGNIFMSSSITLHLK